MLSLNIRIVEKSNIVIIRGLEFPNVIVQGKTINEAKQKVLKALEYFFSVSAKIENKKCPPLQKEKIETLRMRFAGNDP